MRGTGVDALNPPITGCIRGDAMVGLSSPAPGADSSRPVFQFRHQYRQMHLQAIGDALQRGKPAVLAPLLDGAELRAVHAHHIRERLLTDAQPDAPQLDGGAKALLERGRRHGRHAIDGSTYGLHYLR